MVYNSREEYMQAVNTFIGERTGEDVINFLKDIEDNSNFADHQEMVSKVKEWEDKYNNLMSDYRNRFLTGNPSPSASGEPVNEQPQQEEVEIIPEENIQIEDLFSPESEG